MYKFTATVIEYYLNSIHAALSIIGCFLSTQYQYKILSKLLFYLGFSENKVCSCQRNNCHHCCKHRRQCKCPVIARLCKAKTSQPENALADEISKNIAGHKAENNRYCYSRCDFFESKNNKHYDTDVSTYLQHDYQHPHKVCNRKYTAVKSIFNSKSENCCKNISQMKQQSHDNGSNRSCHEY